MLLQFFQKRHHLDLMGQVSLGVLMTLFMASVSAQTVDRLKAAYVYNFAKFVDLPSPDEKTLRLCVVGKDDLNGALQALQHRVAQGREALAAQPNPASHSGTSQQLGRAGCREQCSGFAVR